MIDAKTALKKGWGWLKAHPSSKGAKQTSVTATPDKHIAAVNFKLSAACMMGCAAYLIWPDNPYWHGFYVLSVLLGAGALSVAGGALHLILKIRKYERDQEEFARLGKPIKQARVPDTDLLKRKGVIRDAKR
ncbi:MAG: hypothetical protein AAF234_06570 [Pseudomonadota bacterium]